MTAKERADAIIERRLAMEPGYKGIAWDIEQAIDAAVKEVTEDDPQWDATDAAHPAWWRGNDAGVTATLAIVRNALHGLKHTGMYGEPMESVVREVESIVSIARELAAKHVRGGRVCSACGFMRGVGAEGNLIHNDGCPVKRLEAFK